MPACKTQIICVTQRGLCTDFLAQLEKIAAAHPKQIILREKDMEEEKYTQLLLLCQKICQRHGVVLFAHHFIGAAKNLGIKNIHLPLPEFIALGGRHDGFEIVGTSVHSIEEARIAQTLGAHYLTAGHIYNTDCKYGLPGRGLIFLKSVCNSVSIPVYAIGGITPGNMPDILGAGAAGGCMMSSLMTASMPKLLIQNDFLHVSEDSL